VAVAGDAGDLGAGQGVAGVGDRLLGDVDLVVAVLAHLDGAGVRLGDGSTEDRGDIVGGVGRPRGRGGVRGRVLVLDGDVGGGGSGDLGAGDGVARVAVRALVRLDGRGVVAARGGAVGPRCGRAGEAGRVR